VLHTILWGPLSWQVGERYLAHGDIQRGGKGMKLRKHLRIVSYVAIPLISILVGCATKPVPEVPERTSKNAIPSSGKRVEFPAKGFSIGSPPVNWEIAEKWSGTVVAWQNSVTRSSIQIYAYTPSALSYLGLAEAMVNSFKAAAKAKDPQAAVTVAEEKEVSFNGRTFYEVLMDFDASPVKGLQMKGKFLMYLLKTEKMDYMMGLTTVLGFYEQDKPVMDEVVRSFASF
jgi:hypothetical protein